MDNILITILLVATILGLFSSEFLEDYGFDESVTSEKGIKLGFDRLVNFSDAVIAIIITLMAIELKVPKAGVNLSEHLLHEMPHFLTFFLSFLIVGAMWLEHHKIFRYVKSYNNKIMALNIVMLLVMSLMPFATGMFATFNTEKMPFIFYVSIIGLTSLMRYFIVLQAEKEKLFSGVNDEAIEKMKTVSVTLPAASLVASILTILLDSVWGGAVFILVPLVLRRLTR